MGIVNRGKQPEAISYESEIKKPLYRGDIGSERIRISKRVRVKPADLTPEFTMRMEEDVLYDFIP